MARTFSGVNQWVSFGDVSFLDNLTAMSVHAWVKVEDITADRAVVAKYDHPGGILLWADLLGGDSARERCWSFVVGDGVDFARVEGATDSVSTAGGWQAVGGSFAANGNLRIYVDGTEDANSPASATSVDNTGAHANALQIGADDGTRDMDGTVAHVAIWNVELSAGEFAALAGGAAPTTIRPGNLLWIAPLGYGSPEPSYGLNPTAGTLNGTPTIADAPPVAPLWGWDAVFPAGGGAAPVEESGMSGMSGAPDPAPDLTVAFSVDSVDVHVHPTGHLQDDRDLGAATRSHAGYLRSNTTATKGREGVLVLETRPMASSLSTTVEAALETVGRITADGYLVQDGPLTGYIRAINRQPNEDAPWLVSFSFEFHPVSTT